MRFCFTPPQVHLASGFLVGRRGVTVGQAGGNRIRAPNDIFQKAWGQSAAIKHFVWWGRRSDDIEVLRERNVAFSHCLPASFISEEAPPDEENDKEDNEEAKD